MLFDWLAKKAARSFLAAQKELQKEERFKEAYKGRETGEACCVRIDAYVAARTAEMKPKFIEVLKGPALNTSSSLTMWIEQDKN